MQDKKEVSVSFVIPAYNAEAHLMDCVNSILETMHPHDEVIIINDGSIDKTEKIAKKIASINRSVTAITQNNRGVSATRNIGIQTAKNDYIMFVDADDMIDESFRRLERNFGRADIVFCVKDMNENITKNDILLHIACLLKPQIPGPVSKFFRRKFLIDQLIMFPKGIINGEDMLFNINALLLADSYKVINDSFYKYRIIDGTATKSFNKNIFKSDKKFHSIINQLSCVGGDAYKSEFEQIKAYNRNNAVITILKRISYIAKYKKAQSFYSFLLDEPYKTALMQPQNTKQKVIFVLCRARMYRLLYGIFRIKRFSCRKKEYFEEI